MIRDFNTKILKPQMFTDEHGFLKKNLTGMDRINGMILGFVKIKASDFNLFKSVKISVLICVNLWLLILLSCSSAPDDLRKFLPTETIVYLETNDLQNTLDSLTESDTFKRLTNSKKEFSALKGVQLAVAVTGFETSEKQVTDSQAVLNFKPKFVAVADTHAWEFQAVSLTENQINNFVNETYGGETALEKTEKNGGKYFIWTAKDGRKIFALVQESLIFFGNDETSIDKSMAAKRGETENFSNNSELATVYDQAKNKLAFGFVSSEGIKQIADFAGVSMAIDASGDDLPRNFIAKILPQILSKSVKKIVWTAEKNEQGIVDNFRFETASEISDVLKETIVATNKNTKYLTSSLPEDAQSATRYNLENPQIAWRSLLLSAGKQTDEQSAKILIAFADSFFAPFGIASGEMFLNSIGSEILTARFDSDGEKQVAIVTIKNEENLKKSLLPEFKKSEPHRGREMWKNEEDDLSAAFDSDTLIIGDSESVEKYAGFLPSSELRAEPKYSGNFSESRAAIVTVGKDDDQAHKIAAILGNVKNKDLRTNAYFLTETKFEGNAFVRKTTSDFGFVGTILEQFAEN